MPNDDGPEAAGTGAGGPEPAGASGSTGGSLPPAGTGGEGAGPPGKSSTGLDDNIAGALCYLLGFLTGIVFLVLEKDSEFVRFHAMQSTITFVGLFVLSFVLSFVPLIGCVLWIATVVVWILAMIKAFQGERYKLPLVGDLTEKQLSRA